VGWVDDHRPLPPWTRLLAHALAAACLGGGMLAAGLPTLFVVAGAGLALVLTNVWNFMDGIDALAASQGLLVALACAAFAVGGPAAWLALALAAACAGFLPFNLPGARIFLGDVGSGALGFLLAALVVWSGSRAPGEAPLLLLPLSAFLLDASLTLAGRVWRGEPWWLPHTQHAYQCWVRRRGRHGPVSAVYALWTFLATVAMLVLVPGGSAVKMLALPGCCLGGAIAWTWLQRAPLPPGDKE
jgi:UDP-N-acetylmuramyl pentapeptide phosphotransferase/UDP-N-acetylglucosamine-1-phosphate transferase